MNLTADATIPFAFGGNLIVNKNDAFTLTLAGTVQPAATTTGIINVNAGTLVVPTGTPVSPGMSFSVAAGATMSFGSFDNNNTDDLAFGTLTVNGGIAKVPSGSGDLAMKTIVVTGGTLDFTGTINMWLHLRNSGASINTLASSTTTTFIQGASSTSRIQNDTGAPIPINVAAGSTPSGIDLDNGILMSNAGANANFVKTGAGVMRLNNVNSTASFQVNVGTIRVDSVGGSGSGAITVNAGGTLAGTGTVNGAVTAAAGGAIGPSGSTLGTLTAANNLTMTAAAPGSGSFFNVLVSRLAANSAAADLLIVSGAANRLNFTGLATGTPTSGDNKFRINLRSDPANPLVPGESYTITIAQTPGVQRNGTAVGPTYTFNPNDYQIFSPNFTAFNSTSLIVDGSNNVVMTFVPVPEPATVLGLAAAGFGAAGFLRRRFTKSAV